MPHLLGGLGPDRAGLLPSGRGVRRAGCGPRGSALLAPGLCLLGTQRRLPPGRAERLPRDVTGAATTRCPASGLRCGRRSCLLRGAVGCRDTGTGLRWRNHPRTSRRCRGAGVCVGVGRWCRSSRMGGRCRSAGIARRHRNNGRRPVRTLVRRVPCNHISTRHHPLRTRHDPLRIRRRPVRTRHHPLRTRARDHPSRSRPRPIRARCRPVRGLAFGFCSSAGRSQGLAGGVGGAGAVRVRHGVLRRETRSDSSRSVSSVSAASPEPRTASASARLAVSISAMRSSTVPSVTRRWTWTGWVWPMR